MKRAALIIAVLLALAAPALAAGPAVTFLDADRNGRDSPGDQLVLHNDALALRFLFADLATPSARVSARENGWYLDSVAFRGETFFQHPDLSLIHI